MSNHCPQTPFQEVPLLPNASFIRVPACRSGRSPCHDMSYISPTDPRAPATAIVHSQKTRMFHYHYKIAFISSMGTPGVGFLLGL